MDKNFDLTNRIKNETNFAKTIMTRYKMSNTKHKDFVNIVLLQVQEVKQFFDIKELSNQLKLLGFYFVALKNNPEYIGIVRNNETRRIEIGKALKIKEYL